MIVGVVIVLAMVAGAGWVAHRFAKRARFQANSLRQRIAAGAGPGELVVIDDRILGWELQRSTDGLPGGNLSVMDDDVAPSSLLADLEKDPREVIVVARPDARMLKTLSAAGYVLVPEAGSRPWDTGGRGSRVFGWGAMRIFFVRPPQKSEAGAEPPGSAVSSEMKDMSK